MTRRYFTGWPTIENVKAGILQFKDTNSRGFVILKCGEREILMSRTEQLGKPQEQSNLFSFAFTDNGKGCSLECNCVFGIPDVAMPNYNTLINA